MTAGETSHIPAYSPVMTENGPGPGEPSLSTRRMSEITGLSLEQLAEIRLAAGLDAADPDAVIYSEDDIEAVRVSILSSEMFGWPSMIEITRVLGSAVSRITDAADAMFLSRVEMPMVSAGATEEDFAPVVERARGLAQSLVSVLRMLMRQHLDVSIERHRSAIIDSSTSSPRTTFAVGFVDLVGFTARSAEMNTEDLDALVGRFEAIAHDSITSNHGRLVKFIGDEVMFVAVDAVDGCRIAADLMRRFGEDERLTPRGGLAHGEVLSRGGDFFGPTVNLAARLADAAVPGEVLVPVGTAGGADGITLETAGRRSLKGFAEPVSVASLTAG